MQPPAFSSSRFCAIKVYSVLPVVTNEEQNLGGIMVMFCVVFFPGHSGLAFDVNGYSAIELSASANWFQWSVKFRYIYETGYSSHREVFLFLDNASAFHENIFFLPPCLPFLTTAGFACELPTTGEGLGALIPVISIPNVFEHASQEGTVA